MKSQSILYVFAFIAFFLLGVYAYVHQQIGRQPSQAEQVAFKQLPYYKEGLFQSARKTTFHRDKISGGSPGFLRFFSRSVYAPAKELPHEVLTRDEFTDKPADFAFYWLGHSSLIFELAGKRLVIDPVLENAGPLPFITPRYGKSVIDRSALPHVDYILITHNHYDHLEKKTVTSIKRGHFIVPLGVATLLQGWGIDGSRITELGWGESFQDGELTVTALEGVHFSGRKLSDRNKTLWASYVLKTDDKKIFWGGDGGYGEHFARHGEDHGPFDLVALEIDAWNTGWPQTHLFPHEVAKAASDLQAKRLLPIHWGVFDLALHPWDESIELVLKESEGKEYTVWTPKMGQRVNSQDEPTERWWRQSPHESGT